MRDSNKKGTNNASVIRVIKNKNYTTMSNIHLFNRELSLKAKGLMSLCLALPESWDYSVAGLMTLSNDGRDSVTSAIKALQKHGFLKIEIERTERGNFCSTYVFFENPDENPDFKKDLTVTENPLRENRCGSTDAENLEQLNTNNELLTLNTNNEILVNPQSEFTFEDLKNLYDLICIHFPKVQKITDGRKTKASLRLKEYPEKNFWETVFQKAENSNFIRSKQFFCFDWVLKNSNNALKVFEGNYDNKGNNKIVSVEFASGGTSKYSGCYE